MKTFDTVATLLAFLGFAVFVGWASFSHPEMTRTQLALTYWPALVVLMAVLAIISLIARWGRRA